MTDAPTPPPAQVLSYASAKTGNRPAAVALVWGLLNFIPFLSGIVALLYARRGLQLAKSTGVGREKARAAQILGLINLIWPIVAAANLYPAMQRSQRARDSMQCAMNLRQIGLACYNYASANAGYFPPNLPTLVNAGFLPAVPVCPTTTRSGIPGPYVYIAPTARLHEFRNPAGTVLAYEPLANHDGHRVSVLFIDGHVTMLFPSAAAQILPPSFAVTFAPTTSPAP